VLLDVDEGKGRGKGKGEFLIAFLSAEALHVRTYVRISQLNSELDGGEGAGEDGKGGIGQIANGKGKDGKGYVALRQQQGLDRQRQGRARLLPRRQRPDRQRHGQWRQGRQWPSFRVQMVLR